MIRFSTSAVIAVLTSLVPVVGPAAQTVSMVSTGVKVLEGPGVLADVQVQISSEPSTYVTVTWIAKGGSATEEEDYSGSTGKVYFMPKFGELVESIQILITDDMQMEETESFTVVLTNASGGGATLGQPTATQVIIVDDDEGGGGPVAYVDTGSAYPNSQGLTYLFGPLGGEIPVTIRLNQVPQVPFEVFYSTTWPPYAGSVTFDDTDEQVVVVDVPDESPHALGTFGLVAGRDGGARGLGVGLGGFGSVGDCVACLLAYYGGITSYFDCDPSCDVPCFAARTPKPSEAPWLSRVARTVAGAVGIDTGVLRSYRDEVLAKTDAGEFYIEQYETFSDDIGAAILGEPTFVLDLLAMQGPWVTGIAQVVAGTGDAAVITQDMETELNEILDRLEALGNPALVEAIQLERTRLALDDVAGMTMEELQTRIETDGGGTAVLPMSWGALKHAFR